MSDYGKPGSGQPKPGKDKSQQKPQPKPQPKPVEPGRKPGFGDDKPAA